MLLQTVKLVDNFDAEFEYITHSGRSITFKTNHSAPKYRLISVDLDQPEPQHWKDVVPEGQYIGTRTLTLPKTGLRPVSRSLAILYSPSYFHSLTLTQPFQ